MHHVLFTIDVEDWYQVENFKKCIPFSSWSSRESRVERNTHLLLDLLDSVFQYSPIPDRRSTQPKATFFVLGWLAKRLPGLVREINGRGHEVASHGYYHNLCSECTPGNLRNDLTDTRQLLEDIIGTPVHGYRAPSFSIGDGTLKTVEECGYKYDSSFNSFALNERHGRIDLSQDRRMGIAYRVGKSFFELPISNLDLCNCVAPLGGGGYFRLVPLPLFICGVRSILRKRDAYLFYLHPWEVDPDQPRVNEASKFFKLRHYLNLEKTLHKLTIFLQDLKACRFVTCSQYLDWITTVS